MPNHARPEAPLDLDELLDATTQAAISLARAEGGCAGLLTPQGMVSRRYLRNGAAHPLDYCWPPMHGFPGWVMVHKAPYLAADVRTDAQRVPELCAQLALRSALSVPILGPQEEMLGFLEVHNKADGAFCQADAEQLLGLARAAAPAVRNALAYRKLQQAEAALRESDRRKDQFLGTLAHELRNPLAPLRNSLHIMQLAGDNRQITEHARLVMERQVQQLARLVDDLQDLSRMTRGKVELRRERIPLQAAIQRAVEASRPLIDQCGHSLAVLLPPDPLYLNADMTRLSQVFAKLLANACKYTRRGGRIELTAERCGREAVVRVTDSGRGIPPEALPGLFDMFAHVDRAPEEEGLPGGLGVGLALVRGLVEMHGGSVQARSAGIGHGSEFTVCLPIAPEQAPAAGPAEASRDAARKRRILVVDDNMDSANTLGLLLTLMGHEVRTAYNGVAAMEAAEAFRPGTIVMDIGMPRLNGYEAARQIRERPWGRDVTLVAATGWGQESDKRRAEEAGFDFHMTKPVNPELLVKLARDGAPAAPPAGPPS